MLNGAKTGIKDWEKTSICNKGFTKGVAWNIFGNNFDVNHDYHILAKTNMIRAFGEFLPDELKPIKGRKEFQKPIHHDPIF